MARRARLSGPEALRNRSHSYQTSRLSDKQRARIACDLKERSAQATGTRSPWTRARLLRHIFENYRVRFSLRHCRRLLISLGAAKGRTIRPAAQERQHDETAREEHHEAELADQSIGDHERKRRSLARIKRLASSGLPLQAFAYTLFDLVRDAVPYDQTNPGFTVETNGGASWITRDFDYSRWFPAMQKYVLDATPEISSLRPALLPWNPNTVLCHEQMALPPRFTFLAVTWALSHSMQSFEIVLLERIAPAQPALFKSTTSLIDFCSQFGEQS